MIELRRQLHRSSRVDELLRKFGHLHVFRVVIVLCPVLGGGLLLSSTPASALPQLTSVAVDNSALSPSDLSAGDVYVATVGGSLYRFDGDGALEAQIGLPEGVKSEHVAVDSSGTSSTGDVYVAGGGVLYKLQRHRNGDGGEYEIAHEITGLADVAGLAVDAAGDVYVAQSGARAGDVLKFSSAGEPLNEGKPVVEMPSALGGIEVDAQGDLYAAGEMGTVEFTPTGGGGFSAPKTIDSARAADVAVDSSTGDVYVDDYPAGVQLGGSSSVIEEFDSSGSPVGLPITVGGFSQAIAESEETKYVFATNWNALVVGSPPLRVFGLFTVQTGGGGCSPVGPVNQTLCGNITLTGGGEVHYSFEYGTTTAYGSASPVEPGAVVDISSGKQSAEVTADLSELLPNTTYHYRLAATGPHSKLYGADGTFESFLPKPAVVGESTKGVTTNSAMLSGKIDSENGPAHYRFEYGTTTAYASEGQTPTHEIIAGTSNLEVEPEELSGLQPDTEYHYRLIAENATGVTEGENKTFTTLPPAAVITGPVGAVESGPGTQVTPPAGIVTPPPSHTGPRLSANAQKLAKLLKLCEKRPKRRRTSCEKRARKQYSYGTTTKKTAKQSRSKKK